MKILLTHCPNPDILHDERAGYWRPVREPEFQTVDVGTLAEASGVLQDFVERTGIGNGNCGRSFGKVLSNEGDRFIARVSYNGRVWTPGEWLDSTELVVR